jgi:hypothetical protein
LLHQGKDLKKQDIRAVDGEIGTVHDFLFDDKYRQEYICVYIGNCSLWADILVTRGQNQEGAITDEFI